ncbi:MAG: phosphoribosylaminoimidazolesuccinocarboxamide synthase [Candidatus Micrarchaeota archaeon]
METVMKTELQLPLLGVGKVRETYLLQDKLLMVATDRLSAFDVVFHEGIPHKGIVLNMLSKFWFEKTTDIIKNHFVSVKMPPELPAYLRGRSMIVQQAKPLRVECVVRGYITGSAWKEYQQNGSVCGIELEKDLKNGSRLSKPIFTPSTKAEKGHDENISFEQAAELIGEKAATAIRDKSLKLYEFGRDYSLKKGLVLADTKFEFGLLGDKIILIDEAMTPDSSRYWISEEYNKGNLVSMDKQFVRDFLERSNWNKSPPPPKLPADVVANTSKLYVKTYEMLTDRNVLDDVKNI